jgi:hypothetical protein
MGLCLVKHRDCFTFYFLRVGKYSKRCAGPQISCFQNPILMNVKQVNACYGRAIAQAVSRWLPTAAARVQTRVYSCGISGGQCGAGAGFLRVLRFPPPIFIPPILPQSPSRIIRGWYNRPVVAAVPKVPPRKLRKKKLSECLFLAGH